QALEGLRARHLVYEVTVDVEKVGAVRLGVYDVVVPNLVVKGFWFHGLWLDGLNSRCRFGGAAPRKRISDRGASRRRRRGERRNVQAAARGRRSPQRRSSNAQPRHRRTFGRRNIPPNSMSCALYN